MLYTPFYNAATIENFKATLNEIYSKIDETKNLSFDSAAIKKSLGIEEVKEQKPAAPTVTSQNPHVVEEKEGSQTQNPTNTRTWGRESCIYQPMPPKTCSSPFKNNKALFAGLVIGGIVLGIGLTLTLNFLTMGTINLALPALGITIAAGLSATLATAALTLLECAIAACISSAALFGMNAAAPKICALKQNS